MARGVGRGSTRDVVDRVFADSATLGSTTFSTHPSGAAGQTGVAESAKRRATHHLRDMLETCGESERVMTGGWPDSWQR